MSRPSAPLSVCAREVRDGDPDRFFCTLFAAPDRREDLFALYAFHLALARVCDQVSQPLLGEIRLQWWREGIEQAFAGTARAQPTLAALADAARRRALDRAAFERMIDARMADFDESPPASLQALESRLEGTQAACLALGLAVLGVGGKAVEAVARHVGIAYGLAGILRALPGDARRRRVLLPANVMAAEGIDAESVARGERSPGLARTVAALAELARAHLANARRIERHVPRAAVPALLLATLAERDLATLARAGHDPYARTLDRGGVARRLWATQRALRGRF